MSEVSIEQKKVTVTLQVLIAIVTSTIVICITVITTINDLKSGVNDKINKIESRQESDNKIRDLKFEHLKLEVDRLILRLEADSREKNK